MIIVHSRFLNNEAESRKALFIYLIVRLKAKAIIIKSLPFISIKFIKKKNIEF